MRLRIGSVSRSENALYVWKLRISACQFSESASRILRVAGLVITGHHNLARPARQSSFTQRPLLKMPSGRIQAAFAWFVGCIERPRSTACAESYRRAISVSNANHPGPKIRISAAANRNVYGVAP